MDDLETSKNTLQCVYTELSTIDNEQLLQTDSLIPKIGYPKCNTEIVFKNGKQTNPYDKKLSASLKDVKTQSGKFKLKRKIVTYRIQYGFSILSTMAMLAAGMHLGWIGPTLHKLFSENSPIPTTSSEGSWIASMNPLGGIFGPICGSILADKFGRKTSIVILTIPFIITWVTISLANNIYFLCFAQLISGIGAGAAFTVLPMYIGEITSPHIRGICGTLISIQYNVGILIESVMVPYFSIRTNALIVLTIPVILFFAFMYMPESPYYYLMKSQPEKAANSLRILTQTDNVDKHLKTLKEAIEEERKENVNFLTVFKHQENRYALLVAMGVITIQELSGINPIVSYAQVVFEQTHASIDANVSGIILCAAGLVFRSLCSLLVDSWGRRPLLMLSSVACAIPLSMIGSFFLMQHLNYEHESSFRLMPVIALVLYKLTSGVGLGPLPPVVLSEMFATNVKGYASCIVCTFDFITNFMLTKSFQMICDNFGVHSTFYLFAICCVSGGIFVYFIVPETKEKSLEEIQNNLKKRKSIYV